MDAPKNPASIPCFSSKGARTSKALFHANGTPITTRIIEKRSEAVGVIDSVFVALEQGFESVALGKGHA